VHTRELRIASSESKPVAVRRLDGERNGERHREMGDISDEKPHRHGGTSRPGLGLLSSDSIKVETNPTYNEAKPTDERASSADKATQKDVHSPRQVVDGNADNVVSDATKIPPALSTGEPAIEAPLDVPPPYSIHTPWGKRLIVLAAAISAFFSPLTAQIYLPALNALAADFQVTDAQINLTVTTYMIFQGVTPMFIGGFADTAGRRPAYVICFVIYIAANIGLALSPSYAALLILRCLQSAGSSTTVALCQAVVADIVTSAERGQFIGITVIPIVLAPSLGPVVGGLLSQRLSWRWIFWFLTILATVDLVALLLFFPETCRLIVGDGSVRAHPIYRTCWQMIKDSRESRALRKKTTTRTTGHNDDARNETGNNPNLQRTTSSATHKSTTPKFRFTPPNLFGSLTLLFQKELGLLLSYTSVVFAGFYAIATGMPSLLAQHYDLDETTIGLMYLPMAGGSIVAAFVMGKLVNNNYARHATLLGLPPIDKTRQTDLTDFPIERARLEVGVPLLALSTAVMIAWGWALQYGASLAVPCVLLFLMGIGMIGFNNCANTLIIDVYPGRAGAATAANNLTRCLLGAVASAVIVPMINAMGAGWAYTLIGLLYVVFSPALYLVMKNGMRWRAEERAREEKKAASDEAKRQNKGLAGEAVVSGEGEDEDSGNADAHAKKQDN
jgi:multidrug resistance protein